MEVKERAVRAVPPRVPNDLREVTVSLTSADLTALDAEVKNGGLVSRSAAVREAVRAWLKSRKAGKA